MASNPKNSNAKLVAGLTLAMIAVHLYNVLQHGQLNSLGILPRSLDHLPHIFTAPFVHGSWIHLLNNVIGFVIFSSLALLKSRKFYIYSSYFIVIFSGLLVWLFGRPAMHIGASGWIFGLWTLTIANAYYDRSFFNFCIAVFVVLIYGGMAMGLMPTDTAVSFEAHIAGAISGVIAANLFKRYR